MSDSARIRLDWRALALELGPLALVIAGLTAKLLYFYVAVPWWGSWRQWTWWSQAARVSASSLGAFLILSAGLCLVRPRRRLWILLAAGVASSLLVLSDVLYLRFFGDILSVDALSGTRQLATEMVATSVLTLLEPQDVLFVADVILFALLLPWLLPRVAAARPQRPFDVSPAVLALATGVALSVIPIRAVGREGAKDYYAYLKLHGAAHIGLINYHLYDAGRALYLRTKARTVSDADRAGVAAFLERRRETTAARSPLFGIARGRNVIVVMVESLVAFPMGLRVNGRDVTPHLDALARRSLAFESFYDQTWRGRTADGEFTALQSLHPLADGAVSLLHGDDHFRALPQVLQDHGYATLSAHAYSPSLWMLGAIHVRYGFEENHFQESFRQSDRVGLGLSDRAFFEQTVPWLEGTREPFMAHLITLSTHHPYPMPRRLQGLDLGQLNNTVLGRYLQSVHYVDGALGEFLDRLQADGLLDRSILVVFGDHVASLGRRADLDTLLVRYFGFPPRAPGFDERYWRANTRLPLLIHLPHDSAAGPRSASGGQLDIAPTILSLLGIEDPDMVALGRDLTADNDPLVVFRDGGIVAGDTVCAVPSTSLRALTCRDLRTGATLDPGRMRPRLSEARRRLDASDLIVEGDLIVWASRLAAGSPRRAPGTTRGLLVPAWPTPR